MSDIKEKAFLAGMTFLEVSIKVFDTLASFSMWCLTKVIGEHRAARVGCLFGIHASQIFVVISPEYVRPVVWEGTCNVCGGKVYKEQEEELCHYEGEDPPQEAPELSYREWQEKTECQVSGFGKWPEIVHEEEEGIL